MEVNFTPAYRTRSAMNIINDSEQFNDAQEGFLRALVRAVRLPLGEAGIESEQAFEITQKIVFSVASLIDGATVSSNGQLKPALGFREGSNLHLTADGGSLHEQAFDVTLEVCGDIDEVG